MKIERISESTVKLTLNDKDFEKRSINVQKLRVDSPTYQKLLWDALEHAEIELGVHISTGKIRVEAAGEQGSYEITVTNIPGAQDLPAAASSEQLPTPSEHKPAEIRGIQPLRQAVAIPAHVLAQMVRQGMLPSSLLRGGVSPAEPGNSGLGELTGEDIQESTGESSAISVLRLTPERVMFPDQEGNGVVCFRDYNEMYGFFKANPSFAVLSAALYMLEGAFYLVVHDSGRRGALLSRLEVRLADYNTILLPADVFMPMLEEYGTVVFKKGAIKKIIASLGE